MGTGFRLPKDGKIRYMIYTLTRLPHIVPLIARWHRGQWHASYYLRATLQLPAEPVGVYELVVDWRLMNISSAAF